MARNQLRLLLLSVAAVVLIVAATFFSEWFVIHIGGHEAYVDLRRIRVCAPQCVSGELGSNGIYSSLARVAFWGALPLFVIVATQAGAKLLSGYAYRGLANLGTGLGAIVFFAACGAGFLAIPDVASVAGFDLVSADRQWGPLLLIAGSLAAVLAVREAMQSASSDEGEYRPVVIPGRGDSRESSRIPVTPLSVKQLPRPVDNLARAKAPSQPPRSDGRPKSPTQPPDARIKAPTQPPLIARTTSSTDARTKSPTQPPAQRIKSPTPPPDARIKSPTQPPDARIKSPTQPPDARIKSPTQPSAGLDLPARTRTSSSGPVDVAARLEGAGLEVSMRPPLPAPVPTPEDQIAVAPESGLVIRKRTPTAGPIDAGTLPLPPDIGVTIRTKPPSIAPPMMPSVASALGIAPPSPLTGRVKYAVTTAAFSGTGITATREDGLSKLIKWTDIVGIVARRLPSSAPYEGLPFVDIVSSAGSTMRLMPTTEIVGLTIEGDVVERARTLVNLLAAQALDAKLDSATKVFATGTNQPAQLRDDKTLDTHDARLA